MNGTEEGRFVKKTPEEAVTWKVKIVVFGPNTCGGFTHV
jgi:hypothetical protein